MKTFSFAIHRLVGGSKGGKRGQGVSALLFLLFFLSFLFAIPARVRAQATCPDDPEVAAILALPPMNSPYITAIIERAEDGIALAQSQPVVPPNYSRLALNLLNATAAVNSLIDTKLRQAEHERNLPELTACLHVDLLILEAEMEKVRCELKTAYLANQTTAIPILHSVLDFLNERFGELIRGALNHTVKDETWEYVHLFEQRSTLHDEEWCPFHTDYLPPTVAGYGCDEDVLRALSSLDSALTELRALEALTGIRDTFLTNIGFLPNTVSTLHSLQGRTPPDTSRFGDAIGVPHRQRFGCGVTEFPEGAAAVAARGGFAAEKNDESILRALRDKGQAEGKDRPQADYLKLPSEVPPGPEQAELQKELERSDNLLYGIIRFTIRTFFTDWNAATGWREAELMVKGADQMYEVKELLEPLREQVDELTNLSSSLGKGLRGFTRNYAYFLRRSCVFRPCNALLDRVLKIVFADECFPYATGAYEGDSSRNEREQKCESEAGL